MLEANQAHDKRDKRWEYTTLPPQHFYGRKLVSLWAPSCDAGSRLDYQTDVTPSERLSVAFCRAYHPQHRAPGPSDNVTFPWIAYFLSRSFASALPTCLDLAAIRTQSLDGHSFHWPAFQKDSLSLHWRTFGTKYLDLPNSCAYSPKTPMPN